MSNIEFIAYKNTFEWLESLYLSKKFMSFVTKD